MSDFLNNLFSMYPGNTLNGTKLAFSVVIAIVLLIAFIFLPVFKKKTKNKALKKVLARSRGGLMGFSLGIFFLTLMRVESVPFLSMRLWFYLTFLGLLGWSIWKGMLYKKIDTRIKRADARRKKKDS